MGLYTIKAYYLQKFCEKHFHPATLTSILKWKRILEKGFQKAATKELNRKG